MKKCRMKFKFIRRLYLFQFYIALPSDCKIFWWYGKLPLLSDNWVISYKGVAFASTTHIPSGVIAISHPINGTSGISFAYCIHFSLTISKWGILNPNILTPDIGCFSYFSPYTFVTAGVIILPRKSNILEVKPLTRLYIWCIIGNAPKKYTISCVWKLRGEVKGYD